jgi:hypothetical protein
MLPPLSREIIYGISIKLITTVKTKNTFDTELNVTSSLL